jgi:hypothetical protein
MGICDDGFLFRRDGRLGTYMLQDTPEVDVIPWQNLTIIIRLNLNCNALLAGQPAKAYSFPD